jgi:hypothetical protein
LNSCIEAFTSFFVDKTTLAIFAQGLLLTTTYIGAGWSKDVSYKLEEEPQIPPRVKLDLKDLVTKHSYSKLIGGTPNTGFYSGISVLCYFLAFAIIIVLYGITLFGFSNSSISFL